MTLNLMEVVVSPAEVRTERRLLGRVVRRRPLPRGDIVRIERKAGTQTNTGANTSVYYRLVAKTEAGEELAVGDSLRGTTSARVVQKQLLRSLGLPEEQAV